MIMALLDDLVVADKTLAEAALDRYDVLVTNHFMNNFIC